MQASMLGLPNNLKDVAKVLNLDDQKDAKRYKTYKLFFHAL